jgi:hypothetical protein
MPSRAILAMLSLLLVIQTAPARAQTWSVGEPVWRLGGDDSPVQLFRPGAAQILGSGDLALANVGNREILIITPEGMIRWRRNRKGRGPGEFESLDGVTAWRGDSAAAVDGALRRVTVFAPTGEYGRSFALPDLPPGSAVTGIHWLQPDALLVGTQRGRMPGSPTGLIRNAGAFLVLDGDGNPVSTIGEIAGDEWFTDGEHRLLGYMPFGRVTRYATRSNAVFVADGTDAAVRRISIPSRNSRLLRIPHAQTGQRVTPSQVRTYKARRLADAGSNPAMARWLDEVPFPTQLPPTRGLVIDTQANIWVEQYPPPGAETVRWTVMSADGTAVSTVTVPANRRIIASSDDAAYALESDDLGTEVLVRLPMRRGTR